MTLTKRYMESLRNSPQDDYWFCVKCINENLPFGIQSPTQITLNKARTLSELKDFLSKLNSLDLDATMDESLFGIDCKYYDQDTFAANKFGSNNFSVFHLNIASHSTL